MLPAAMGLKTYLAKVAIKPPLIPVINNVDVAILSEPDAIRDALVRQLYHPVQWVNTIEYMQSQGISIAIECGPGNILAGLVKRIVKDLQTITLETQVPIENAIALV
jgi:[acyl-carrier-protein] S-malonyltransferase